MSLTPNFAIENVDLTVTRVGVTQTLADYPQFEQMEVGQSFFVPNYESGRARPVPIKLANQLEGKRFRRVPVEGGVRYGRVS